MSAAETPPQAVVLELRGIVKRFGATRALDGASLRVRRGSVHGLVGENGAGKSTLIKVLAGIHRPDAGSLLVDGRAHAHFDPRQVERLGIRFIHQERLLPAGFTVDEALFFGQERRLGPWLDRRAQRREAERLLEHWFGLRLPAGALVGELSSAEQQVLQIVRALIVKPRVLVFDEPSVALVRSEVERLLCIVRRLRDEGLAIVYISHYLQEIEALCDRVTVLRNGRDVAEVDPRATSPERIARLMVNREVGELYPKSAPAPGAPLLEVRGLGRGRAYRDIDLRVRRGEVVGLTGLVGSGAKELLKSLFGLAPPDTGEVRLDGRPLALRTPRQAVAEGIALLPEERRRQGVALDLSVQENVTLAALPRFSRFGLLSRRAERRETLGLIERLRIKSAGPQATVRQLSGGNQQKVALAKWFARRSSLYLLDEPSVGIDIGAKAEIYRLIGELAREGAGVLILSSDLPELLGLCERIHVMHRGRIAARFEAGEADSDKLLAVATGAVAQQETSVHESIPG
ncbi:ABC transporter [Azotobacter vinelandii CA]|uniref:ABC transporter n=2 Tax=Azotobacter vinelandii TaxID=354 RepID=C1DFT6_AZOVD|nr:sugar ABC transporter ATP-binding protein [Azotobacter vinelandii]ACO80482.1 ABC transporter [Azotobacter vinelandii DJ]AGK15982.1 ABC transporter [Azotobacter vinelandii CA]AGK21941.1 ABC transporter [Azotobacter vinelandii CA6]WKN21252.1 sugar ABC transporter ATP-binding protein [Azotobacter vinelandii]SFX35346.1 monosaccharide ABC transporter ATP-binding protein, CUT2 family [Azotobacter vinelandii]